MPFEVTLEPNEEVVFIRELRMKNADPFALAVSTLAIYLPSKRLFAARDPWYFRRIPLSAIRQVSVETLKPIFLYLLAACMVLAGSFALYLVIGNASAQNQPENTKAIGYSAALLIVGIILPFFAKGRRALVIRMIDETYRWKPQLVVDRASTLEIEQLQNEFLEACKRVGIATTDAIH